MKTSELTGAQLDYWVAKAENRAVDFHQLGPHGGDFVTVVDPEQSGWVSWSPSRVWADGGPIIDRENLLVAPNGAPGSGWHSRVKKAGGFLSDESQGPTALIAAMRAYVTLKFGDEVVGGP